MRPLSRRSLLTRGALGGAGLAAGLGRRAHAQEPTASQRALLLPEEARPDGVLELFLFGGVNPFDTFYVLPEYGAGSPGAMWHAFQDGPGGIPAWYDRCGGTGDLLHPFAEDELGHTVQLGPFLYPLREREDLLARMRILVLAHDDSTHQSGVPHMLCGHRRNNPRMAATPTHVQRHFLDTHGQRDAPWSWVLYPDLFDLAVLNGDSASAVGLHRASARPLSLRLGAEGLDAYQLSRPTHGGQRTAHDALVAHYTQRYRDRFRRGGDPIRSRHLEDFEVARAALERTPQLLDLLPKSAFAARAGAECGDTSDTDYTAMGLDLGVHLLTQPSEAARYVTVVDGGLLPAAGGGAYDTHIHHVSQSARNVVHMARELAGQINRPDEGDPRKIDLDRHLVLITTEFGRSPAGNGGGLDHWPGGYAVVMLGGPVQAPQRGVVGAIDDLGLGVEALSPADFRAALLVAQGIWPFSDASFAVGDISEGDDEERAAAWLRERVLGWPT